jgi:hypothetical protein
MEQVNAHAVTFHARSLLAGLVMGCCLTAPAISAESVQALRYGVTLFHYFQQDYFNALTELMVAQETNELGVHKENAEILRGGISLSYGMDQQAETIFERYLQQTQLNVNRERAWFFLARIAWQRGELERSAQAMNHIGGTGDMTLEPELAQELIYMQASLEHIRGNEKQADSRIAQLPTDSDWLPYHYYNMGASRAATEDWSGAGNYFRRFDQLKPRSEEAKALRDRAYTASGFAYMAAGDYAQAGDDFTRVRLHSPLANRALLGYGLAASKQYDYTAALSPWQALHSKSALSPSVRESLLAVPYAYEQLGRDGLALASYQNANKVFFDELESLQQGISIIEQSDMLDLLELRKATAESWVFGSDILPLGPQANYLRQLISGENFQSAMRELRDLHQLHLRLSLAAERLLVLADVDTDQQENWAALIRQDREQKLLLRHQQLKQQIEHLAETLDHARQAADGRALAEQEQITLWQRLEHASTLASVVDADTEKRQQLELYRGLLIWEDSDAFPALLWKNQRQLQELDTLANENSAAMAQLQATIARRTHSGFAARIVSLQQKLSQQGEQVNLALVESSNNIKTIAIAELQNQAQELARYIGQSQLAIARLYDKGAAGGQP